MSKTNNEVQETANNYSFIRRFIKKDAQTPIENIVITEQKHLELTGLDTIEIVDDRPVDWFEKQQKDADKVGLANVLEIARRRGDSLEKFAFNDNEAIDISEVDPMNVNQLKESIQTINQSQAKLESIASQLGMTTTELINAFIGGTLTDAIQAKVNQESEVKENA